jgi:hypothetical protein
MRVLVVYGSKRHGIEGIARVVAETYWRDLHQIRNWAQGIAEGLPAVASQVAGSDDPGHRRTRRCLPAGGSGYC